MFILFHPPYLPEWLLYKVCELMTAMQLSGIYWTHFCSKGSTEIIIMIIIIMPHFGKKKTL